MDGQGAWRPSADPRERDYAAFVTQRDDGVQRIELAVEGIRCASCMDTIEGALLRLPGVSHARLNVTEARVAVEWSGDETTVGGILWTLGRIGYRARPFDPRRRDEAERGEMKRLIRAMAVSGFASMNVMLLAIAVWAGNVSDITPETRDLFHWVQAVIALPAAAYAGSTFYEGAWRGLRAGRITMDFPITLGVVLTLVMSVVETARSAEHAYFDAAIMLVFFLLVGRVLDHVMRRRTRALAQNLSALRGETAAVIGADGAVRETPLSAIAPGDRVLVRPGERVAVDGIIIVGTSDLDSSLVTGETRPEAVSPGQRIHAGALNGAGALTVSVLAAAQGTLLQEAERLMEAALARKSGALLLAERATRLYVPLVHAAAALTAIGWLLAGGSVHFALITATAVLLITCPCALGLAIPAVQVVASGALFRKGVLLNAGDALERLGVVDTIIFDKTGTLTLPQPVLDDAALDTQTLALAARLALSSRHPMATALAVRAQVAEPLAGVREVPGEGVEAQVDGVVCRLGSASFCNAQEAAARVLAIHPDASVLCFRRGDGEPLAIPVHQTLRPDAVEIAGALRDAGYRLGILSGDRAGAVAGIAAALGIAEWRAGLTPSGKIAAIEAMQAAGHGVLMVGDGVNDAPALAAADVSLSPVTGAHVTQAAADALFLGERLAPVADLLRTGRKARALMLQNLWFSGLYNVVAIPLAASGWLTPLVAAIAMSGSSVIVTLNALRARRSARLAPATTGPVRAPALAPRTDPGPLATPA